MREPSLLALSLDASFSSSLFLPPSFIGLNLPTNQSGSTKPISTTLKSLLLLSSHLYGSASSLSPSLGLWISPQKFLSIILASSAVLSYLSEDNNETIAHVRSKKDFGASIFDNETAEEGHARAKKDEEEMEVLEDEMDEEVLRDLDLGGGGGRLDRTREELKSVCVSWRGLILARRDWEKKFGKKEEEVLEGASEDVRA